MPHTVVRVEEHGERKEALKRQLRGSRPRGDCRNHGSRLEVPSGVRGDEVRKPEEVERAGQSNARNTVQGRGVPGDLGTVDGEMGRDGAVEALLAQNLLAGFLRGGFCGGEPIGAVSVRFMMWVGVAAAAGAADTAIAGQMPLVIAVANIVPNLGHLASLSSHTGCVLAGDVGGLLGRRTSSGGCGQRAGS